MYIVVDIGGTKTRVAVSRDLREFSEPEVFDTPASYEEGVQAVVECAQRLAGDEITGCAVGIRGRLAPDRRQLFKDGILTDWQRKPLADDLEAALGVPVLLENDAALAGLGEAHFGAGKGYGIVAYHTVSTGVGGARIDHGEIDARASGFEPGLQTIDVDHTICPTCEGADLEGHISGSALERRFGKKPYDIPQDNWVWDQLAHILAHGLKNTVLYWSPHVIVLGGSMILGKPRILLKDIVRHTEEALAEKVACPPIVDAQLGDFGGLYGGMALLARNNTPK